MKSSSVGELRMLQERKQYIKPIKDWKTPRVVRKETHESIRNKDTNRR
jgi:hypothetical protein